MKGPLGPKVAFVGAIVTLAAGLIGLVGSLLLNVFVFDDFDAHGEVPIPGAGSLYLPAGEVTISFHTLVTGGVDGGFPIPPLKITIASPDGVPDAVLSRSSGSTTSVNNDVRARVWVAQIPQAGIYQIRTGGDVDGYIDPRLAFGSDDTPGWLLWASCGLLAVGIAEMVLALTWRTRTTRRPQAPMAPVSLDEPSWPGPLPPAVTDYQPSDQGVRLEQLKTLAALRDSGALTDAEFEAEKKRVLDS